MIYSEFGQKIQFRPKISEIDLDFFRLQINCSNFFNVHKIVPVVSDGYLFSVIVLVFQISRLSDIVIEQIVIE